MEDRCGALAAAKAACTTRQAVAQSAFGLLKDARTWGRLGFTKVDLRFALKQSAFTTHRRLATAVASPATDNTPFRLPNTRHQHVHGPG